MREIAAEIAGTHVTELVSDTAALSFGVPGIGLGTHFILHIHAATRTDYQ